MNSSSENGVNASVEQEKEQIMPKISLSNFEDGGPRLGETIERCFERQAEKLFLYLFKREGLDPTQLVYIFILR